MKDTFERFDRFENFTDVFPHQLTLLRSHEEFETWFLQKNDYSWCSDDEIRTLIDECKPESYPCIPLASAFSLVMMYLKPETILSLSGVLGEVVV